MKKVLTVLCFAVLAGDSLREYILTYDVIIKDSPSEIIGTEDLMGRNEYLRMLVANPATGEVPSDIRTKELLFEQQLLQRALQVRTQALVMESAGPTNVGGRTRAVAFDVRDENTILAGGVSGGVWKSTDGGGSWVKKSNPGNRNSVTCIVQDIRPGHEDTWYHGTGELVGNSARGGAAPFRGNGIYKSTDNGETWNPLSSTQNSNPQVFHNQFQYIWDIEVNPANMVDDEVLVAAYGGILRSLDGGQTWQLEIGQELFNLDITVDLNESNASFYTSIERSANNVFYATLSTESSTSQDSPQAGIYYSLNGDDWNNITPNLDDRQYRRAVIGSSPSNPDITYFMLDSNPILIYEHNLSLINDESRVNGFDTIPRIVPDFGIPLGGLNTQSSYNMMVSVHPEDENTVFIGATNLFRSTDAFRTTENIDWIGGYNPEGGTGLYPNHHPDQHDLLFLPSDPNVAISANDGGLFETNNIVGDSVFWQNKNNGFVTSQFYTIAQAKGSGDGSLIGGMQDNGTDVSFNGSMNWDGIIGGDGGYAATTKNNTLWFASFQQGQTLRLTFNNGDLTSFGRVDPAGLVAEAGSLFLFVNPFVLDPLNQNRMFCAGGNYLYFHPNVSQIPGGSQTPTSIGWKRVNNDPLTSGVVSAVEASYDSETVYFGTTGGQVFRVENAHDETRFVVDEIASLEFPEGGYVSCIAVNPENREHILVIFSNYNVPSIFESTNGGDTFINVSGNLEDNADGTGNGPSVRWAEIVPLVGGTLRLVGTSVGLYSTESTSDFTEWTKESQTILGSSIITMMDYRPIDGRLAIATHGNGVYTTEVPNFSPTALGDIELEPFQVMSTYPNPFRQNTSIQYSIPADGDVRIDILAPNGMLINTILWGPQFAGINTVRWDGNNAAGTSLANGIYFYRVQYNGQSQSGRLVLRR